FSYSRAWQAFVGTEPVGQAGHKARRVRQLGIQQACAGASEAAPAAETSLARFLDVESCRTSRSPGSAGDMRVVLRAGPTGRSDPTGADRSTRGPTARRATEPKKDFDAVATAGRRRPPPAHRDRG